MNLFNFFPKLIHLHLFIALILASGCGVSGSQKDSDSNHSGKDTTSHSTKPSNNDNRGKKIISTYIRSSFYETGQISDKSLLQNNDLIYLAAQPYANGDLFFEMPVSDGTLAKADYISNFKGRSGVIDFTGKGASMNARKNLLNKVASGVKSFTFASWVYIDKWKENSHIFLKQSDWKHKIDIQLGPKDVKGKEKNRIYLHISDGENNYAAADNSGITVGKWHHIAFTYQGDANPYEQMKFYVDGEPQKLWYSSGDGTVPVQGPFVRDDFKLGVDFDGKLDETSINLFSLGASAITNLKNNPLTVDSWNETKTVAYWRYDDKTNLGKDSRTWLNDLKNLKNTLDDHPRKKLRLGISGGAWKKAVRTNSSRMNFVNNVAKVVKKHNLDGADLDFEWAHNGSEWSNYSNAIVSLDNNVPSGFRLSVSLHALFYKISDSAIDAADYISVQSYGPSPERFPYAEFTDNVQTVLDYGIPANKLLMGLPFYCVPSDENGAARAYYDIIDAHPNLDPGKDEASLEVTVNGQTQTKQFKFNGQETINKKADYILSQNLAGAMYWDIATDVDYSNKLSLLRVLTSKINIK